MKKKYQEAAQKKESQKVIVLDKKPDVVHQMRNVKKVCCATTMSGKQCSFKAVCGDFCKKHSVKGVAIGDKVDFSKIRPTKDEIYMDVTNKEKGTTNSGYIKLDDIGTQFTNYKLFEELKRYKGLL